jgi:hypothetical protein
MVVCDLHDEEVKGETVGFGLDGASYEIDLCDEHADAMRDVLAPYVGAARRAGRPAAPAARRSPTSPRPSSGGGERNVSDVREWARANGHTVSERGRISSTVLEAYDAAHPA